MVLYYVAHRLFAAHDRALAAYVAHRIADRLGQDAVFLPFCDTDEENLLDDCKGRKLFELDRARLRRIDAMVAILHGPSLDDGVCMEIGYAAALGVPVIALTTDFQTYGPSSQAGTLTNPCSSFPDPLIQIAIRQIIRQHRLGATEATTATNRLEAFLARNLQALADLADKVTETLTDSMRRDSPPPAPPRNGRMAYLEVSPYIPGTLDAVVDHLRLSGWAVHIATRFISDSPAQAAELDWTALSTATLAVVDVSGPETPPGAAMVIGAFAATARPVFARAPGCWWTFADGREPNYRNLMIQYGVTGTFTNVAELADHLANLTAAP